MLSGLPEGYEHAEAVRKAGRPDVAAEYFAALWQRSPHAMIGWRYAYCLRKKGDLDAAEAVCRDAMARYPADSYTREELSRILHERLFKPAMAAGDLAAAADAGDQILALKPTGLTLALVVLGVMKLAKERQHWQAVLDWSSKVTPNMLDDQPRTVGNERYMAHRLTWYLTSSRALYELKRFDEARELARAGLVEFPGEVFLMRTAALALAESGDLPGAIAEMRTVVAGPRADWYMKAELSELLFRAEQYAEAYRLMCEALSDRRQSEQYKVKCFAVLARLALKLGKPRVAAEHVALAKAVYAESKWRVSPETVLAEQEVKAAYEAAGEALPDLPTSSDQLTQICSAHWRAGAVEGLRFYTGTVKPYPEGRLFTYIRRNDGGDDVYVLVRDLPPACREPGSQVGFALMASFDRKKGRESVRAVHVRMKKRPHGTEP